MESRMRVDLSGCSVALTGAAGGIGRAIAYRFAENGAALLLIDRDEAVEDVATALLERGARAYAMVIDLTEQDAPEEVATHCLRVLGSCDVLINNAATGFVAPLSSTTFSQWNTTLAANLTVPFLLSQAFFNRLMAPKGHGRIVHLASQAGLVALENQSAYCVSKAALLALTRSQALEWGPHGITACAIAPTVVATAPALATWSGEAGRRHLEQIPTGRFADPEEVAASCLYLCSEGANMINGTCLILDGGYTAH